MTINHLAAAGKRLEYTWVNREPVGDEPVLVFLHEGLGCIAMWRAFPEKLAEACGLPARTVDFLAGLSAA